MVPSTSSSIGHRGRTRDNRFVLATLLLQSSGTTVFPPAIFLTKTGVRLPVQTLNSVQGDLESIFCRSRSVSSADASRLRSVI
ncbi:hypothetical protein CRG98_028138 [Punica granatum]|uniref:Uncharacterized protein n=1 Tax=Punica granatum TaxID=22663 RepID=A0A2I0J5D0_PUNGR|nr:hypothetical protein CRG98_028138 [Punica granatum]